MVDIRVQVITVTRALATMPAAGDVVIKRGEGHLILVVKGGEVVQEAIRRHLNRVLLSNMSRESATSVVNSIKWELQE